MAELVGFTGTEARGVDRDLHQLFLEQRNPERLGQARFERRMRVRDRFLTGATPQVRMHRAALDRSRPDERDLDDEVVERARPQPRQRAHLRAALHLEHADGVGEAEHVVDLVFLGDGGEVDLEAFVFLYEVDGEVQHREHSQPEQVELHQARGRGVVLVPLQHRAVLHAGPLHRAELHQRAIGHHHAAGVDAEVAGEIQHLRGEVERERGNRYLFFHLFLYGRDASGRGRNDPPTW